MQACLISIAHCAGTLGVEGDGNDLCQAQQTIMCGLALETCLRSRRVQTLTLRVRLTGSFALILARAWHPRASGLLYWRASCVVDAVSAAVSVPDLDRTVSDLLEK